MSETKWRINLIHHGTAQKMNFSTMDFFSECDQIRSKLRIWSYLLKKSLIEDFIFCAVWEKGEGGDGQSFAWKIVCFNTSFSRLAESLYIIPLKSNLITRFYYPRQLTYFHHKVAVVVKIENTIPFLFNIRFFVFIVIFFQSGPNPANIYMFKVNHRNTRKRCEKCSMLTIKTTEESHWCRSDVIIVIFKHILTFFKYFYHWLEKLHVWWECNVSFDILGTTSNLYKFFFPNPWFLKNFLVKVKYFRLIKKSFWISAAAFLCFCFINKKRECPSGLRHYTWTGNAFGSNVAQTQWWPSNEGPNLTLV